jgi:hypothetical protein
MLRFGIYLMVPPEHQRRFLNPVWKFVKVVNGFVRKVKPAKNVDVL